MGRLLTAIVLLAGCLGSGAAEAADVSGDFDLYVLSLSWSPEYCAANGDDRVQCSLDRRVGLVVHGLWPQYDTSRDGADWPANCPIPRLRTLPSGVTAVYPTEDLFRHEWGEHGSCSGLSPAAYLDLTRKLRQRFQVPAPLQKPDDAQSLSTGYLRKVVLSANPGLPPDGLVFACKGNHLSEIRLCFTKSADTDSSDGRFRACPASMIEPAARHCPSRIRIRALP
ncbi:hypothetical protein ACFPL7_23055 [Dongia soli]|uniref:Uncharacterized protein n=1 Tax=Dongia soli TaxID=600628 RepID=A0ABU5E8D9_9PROT|nr:hypothetical protein [Dongia soli]MDY0882473.1 hypothetical protein [Dongia soli]